MLPGKEQYAVRREANALPCGCVFFFFSKVTVILSIHIFVSHVSKLAECSELGIDGERPVGNFWLWILPRFENCRCLIKTHCFKLFFISLVIK